MSKNQLDKTAKDEDQKLYRDYFNITDMYLIQYSYDPDKKGDDKDGTVEFYGARNSIFLVRKGSNLLLFHR